jgi:hypothetical protein
MVLSVALSTDGDDGEHLGEAKLCRCARARYRRGRALKVAPSHRNADRGPTVNRGSPERMPSRVDDAARPSRALSSRGAQHGYRFPLGRAAQHPGRCPFARRARPATGATMTARLGQNRAIPTTSRPAYDRPLAASMYWEDFGARRAVCRTPCAPRQRCDHGPRRDRGATVWRCRRATRHRSIP